MAAVRCCQLEQVVARVVPVFVAVILERECMGEGRADRFVRPGARRGRGFRIGAGGKGQKCRQQDGEQGEKVVFHVRWLLVNS